MELKSLSSNWKKLQETLKKDVSTAPTPKRKRSDRETQNDLVKKRKTVTEAGKGGKRTSQSAHTSNKRKRMSQASPDGVGKETQSISRKSSTAAFPKDNEGRSSTLVL
jgi:RNA exonuclease 4